MSFVCALVLVCTFVCPAAQASGDGQVTPRSPSCSNCGGGCSRRYVGRHYDSSQVVGDCKHGTHYYAEGGEAWICDDCEGERNEKVCTYADDCNFGADILREQTGGVIVGVLWNGSF